MSDPLSALTKTINQCLEDLESITFDSEDSYSVTLIGIYCSVLGYAKSLASLFKSENYISIKPVFRSLLEAIVDIENLIKDKRYLYNLQAHHDSRWITILNAAESGVPTLKSIAQDPNFNLSITEHKKSLKDHIENGYKPLTIIDKFKQCGMIDVYNSMYRFLCFDTHTSLQSLIARHFELNKNTSLKISLLNDDYGNDIEIYIYETSDLLININQGIKNIFNNTK